MSIISNTGPLIALAKIDQLNLLERLFNQVYIPMAVHHELFAKSGVSAERLNLALNTFIEAKEIQELKPEVKLITRSLDSGEREAIALAYQMNIPLAIDDYLGRQAARRLNLQVMGVVGVLIKAKQWGMISVVIPLLEQIRINGYWLSDELVTIAARLAGER